MKYIILLLISCLSSCHGGSSTEHFWKEFQVKSDMIKNVNIERVFPSPANSVLAFGVSIDKLNHPYDSSKPGGFFVKYDLDDKRLYFHGGFSSDYIIASDNLRETFAFIGKELRANNAVQVYASRDEVKTVKLLCELDSIKILDLRVLSRDTIGILCRSLMNHKVELLKIDIASCSTTKLELTDYREGSYILTPKYYLVYDKSGSTLTSVNHRSIGSEVKSDLPNQYEHPQFVRDQDDRIIMWDKIGDSLDILFLDKSRLYRDMSLYLGTKHVHTLASNDQYYHLIVGDGGPVAIVYEIWSVDRKSKSVNKNLTPSSFMIPYSLTYERAVNWTTSGSINLLRLPTK